MFERDGRVYVTGANGQEFDVTGNPLMGQAAREARERHERETAQRQADARRS